MRKMRKGFTLIELLVVIAILAALSAAMAISSSGAVASAKAATIITNLQTIKTATLVFYNDHMDSGDGTFTQDSFYNVSNDYLDEATRKIMGIKGEGRYTFAITTTAPKQWYVGYGFNTAESDNTQVRAKLIARADNVGLCGGAATSATSAKTKSGVKYTFTAPTATTATTPLTATNTAVWMKVR